MAKIKLDPKVREIAELLGWNVTEEDDGYTYFSQYSPAGEDFGFTVSTENAIEEIDDYYDSFDIDEHIEMWVEAKQNGVAGVPSIRRLVEDAEDIEEMLKILTQAILAYSKKRCTIAESINNYKEGE